MNHRPTLKQLHYLCTVAETLHFGKAAQQCFVTQSTLSAGIHELEETLGLTLLERTNKQVLLTPVGSVIVTRARQVLAHTDELVAAARRHSGPLVQPIRLGVIPTIAPFMLPETLAHLRRAYPSLRILLREGLSAQVLEGLHSGELDLVLLALPYPIEGLQARHLFYDPFVVAYPEGHPFEGRDSVRIDALKGQEMLLLEDGHCLRDHALEACRLKLSQISAPFQATSLHTIVQMVANGIGMTLLPQMALDAGILSGLPVETSELRGDRVWRSISLVWRRSSPRADEFQLIGDEMERIFGNRVSAGAIV